jgi:tight adherence protein C
MASMADSEIARRLKVEQKKELLKARIVQAGMYQQNAATVFGIVRVALMVVPVVTGVLLGQLGFVRPGTGLFVGALCGIAGTVLPSFVLDHRKRNRQRLLRRALPDALDVITVCLEGGMSLSSALSRVARELSTAHPMLALELAIVERETQMGRTTGEAMGAFAQRFDLEEVRSLASVIKQAEKFGSSVTRAMEMYAETLRLKRHQHAEEMAQKAVVKIIFPTLFCIFPGIFVVVLGPAAIQIYTVLVKGTLKS